MPDITLTIIGFEVVAIIIVLILYVIEYRKDKQLQEQREGPLLDELKEKNAAVLHEAIEKSQAIIASAETESLKTIADSNLKAQRMEEEVTRQLTEFKADLQQKLTEETDLAIGNFQAYLATLQSQTSQTQTTSQEMVKQKVNEFIEKFEQELSDFLVQTQQKSLSAIELELTSARNLIATYREQQIKIINENILAMLEQTLALVLTKKMSLKDHMDLIYESLEKAKVEKFIV